MRDDSFCMYPNGSFNGKECPLKKDCRPNIDNHKPQPPLRIYERFKYVDAVSGCPGFLQVSDGDQIDNNPKIPTKRMCR